MALGLSEPQIAGPSTYASGANGIESLYASLPSGVARFELFDSPTTTSWILGATHACAETE